MFRAALAGFAFALAACSSADTAICEPTPITGEIEDGIHHYRGIEYARADRWALPELNPDWAKQSSYLAPGPACPQDGQEVMDERCLYLNVFVPSQARAGDNLRVMVWFHGGGFRAGEGGDGPKHFAKDDIIVVTFNYRLGELGFPKWPGFDERRDHNFGQADMVAALKWVQENIKSFGGDPDQVTLAGHSAGGMGVQLMMVDPRARGTFARAISHAGYGAWPFPKALPSDAPIRKVIKYAALQTEASAETLVAQTPHYVLPTIGGRDLPEQPSAAFAKGAQAAVPYVAGYNSYDGGGTLFGAGFTPEAFLARIDSPEIRAAYADDFAVSDAQAAQRIFGDMRYGYSSNATARAMANVGQPGYLFYFTETFPREPGATHGAQYDRLFGRADFPMKGHYTAFIKTGDPDWPSITSGKLANFGPELRLDEIETQAKKMRAARTALETLRD